MSTEAEFTAAIGIRLLDGGHRCPHWLAVGRCALRDCTCWSHGARTHPLVGRPTAAMRRRRRLARNDARAAAGHEGPCATADNWAAALCRAPGPVRPACLLPADSRRSGGIPSTGAGRVIRCGFDGDGSGCLADQAVSGRG